MNTAQKSFAQRHADLLDLSRYLLHAAANQTLRHDPWFRLKIQTALGEDPEMVPTLSDSLSQCKSRYQAIQDKSWRLKRALSGSGMQCQGKVAVILANIWQEIEEDGQAQGGDDIFRGVDFVWWLQVQFHLVVDLSRQEHALIQSFNAPEASTSALISTDSSLIATHSQQAPNPVAERKMAFLTNSLLSQGEGAGLSAGQPPVQETRQQRRARQRAEEKARRRASSVYPMIPVSTGSALLIK